MVDQCLDNRCFQSPQSGNVVGNGLDLLVREFVSDGTHHPRWIIGTLFDAKVLQLGGCVFGVLSGEARILCRDAGASRAMAAGTSRDAALEVAFAPEALASGNQLLVGCCRRFWFLLREVQCQVLDILLAQG